MSYEDEFGKQYEFESLYRAYSNLGEPESTAIDKVLKDAGITTGFYGLCESARMLCYDIDSEYWEAHKPEWAKATKKSISKPAPKFNDMVKSIRRSASGQIAKSMNKESLKSYIYANYVPVEIPLLVKGVPVSYNNIEGNDVVQFNFEGGELEAVVRFGIMNNTDVNLHICLWDNHEMVDEESMLYSNVDIDWIDELFSDANELLSGICQSYFNMVRNV